MKFNYTSALCQLARLINCVLRPAHPVLVKHEFLLFHVLTTTSALSFLLLSLSPISSRLPIVSVRYSGRRALKTAYINNVPNAVGCVTPIPWLGWIYNFDNFARCRLCRCQFVSCHCVTGAGYSLNLKWKLDTLTWKGIFFIFGFMRGRILRTAVGVFEKRLEAKHIRSMLDKHQFECECSIDAHIENVQEFPIKIYCALASGYFGFNWRSHDAGIVLLISLASACVWWRSLRRNQISIRKQIKYRYKCVYCVRLCGVANASNTRSKWIKFPARNYNEQQWRSPFACVEVNNKSTCLGF